jgi:MFS family permease
MSVPDRTKEFTSASIIAAVVAWIGMSIGPNSMVSASMSLFIAPLTKEFHLSRTTISAILLISPWTTAFFSPLAGRAIDRFGLRRVLLAGTLLFAQASMSRAFVMAPWPLAITFLVVSIASAMNSSVGYAKLVSLWYSHHRGLILGLVTALGAGAGSAIVPQVMRVVIHAYNWRIAYFSLGAYILILPLPLLFFMMREPGRSNNVADIRRAEANLPGLTRAQAIRTPTFWLIFAAIFLASMALIGTTAHAVPLLTERGFSSLIGTTAISCFFFGGIAGQLTAGFVADRINSQRVVLPYFLSALVGAMIVHTATQTGVLLGGALLMGLGQGAEIAFAAYLTSRYFGLKAYGGIYSLFFAASNVGIGVGLMTMGVAHDYFGSYRPMTYVFGGALALSSICIALIGPYAYASRRAINTAGAGGLGLGAAKVETI